MPEGARSFYGGQAPTGGQGGEISAGHYEGPEAHIEAPWKCPACGVQNEAPLKFGCVHCGSGKPGVHVGVQRPPRLAPATTPAEDSRGFLTTLDRSFEIWLAGQPPLDTSHLEIARRAFEAGWKTGAQHQAHQLSLAWATIPSATADVERNVEQLAPAGKPRRTIVAALELFKDQILSQQPEEIVTGEWCSVEEVAALIAQLQNEDEP